MLLAASYYFYMSWRVEYLPDHGFHPGGLCGWTQNGKAEGQEIPPALYVSFFLQLVAGPIERYSRLVPHFRSRHVFTYDQLTNGLRLILYGLFIKMVIADNISGIVDQVYARPASFASLDILKGVVL